jgi:hypothetical protein
VPFHDSCVNPSASRNQGVEKRVASTGPTLEWVERTGQTHPQAVQNTKARRHRALETTAREIKS